MCDLYELFGFACSTFSVEYADLECGYCKRTAGQLKQLYDAYKDDVAFVFKHYPLDMLTICLFQFIAYQIYFHMLPSDICIEY